MVLDLDLKFVVYNQATYSHNSTLASPSTETSNSYELEVEPFSFTLPCFSPRLRTDGPMDATSDHSIALRSTIMRLSIQTCRWCNCMAWHADSFAFPAPSPLDPRDRMCPCIVRRFNNPAPGRLPGWRKNPSKRLAPRTRRGGRCWHQLQSRMISP